MATTYTIINLTNPSATLQILSIADINDSGDVAGAYFNSGDFSDGQLILDAPAYITYSTDATDPGESSGQVIKLNNNGDVLGLANHSSSNPTDFFYSNSTHQFTDIPYGAADLNDSGVVIGSTQIEYAPGFDTAIFVGRGFVYSDGRSATFIDPLVAAGTYRSTTLVGINDSGDVVGNYAVGTISSAPTFAFIFRGGGDVEQTLASDGTWNSTLQYAWDPNKTYAKGDVVTFSAGGDPWTFVSAKDGNLDSAPQFKTGAFGYGGKDSSAWHELGATTQWADFASISGFTLLAYPGASNTHAIAINANDQVLGYYVDSSFVQHFFLYTNGNYTALNDDDPSAKANSTVGVGLNDHGDVVGYYTDNNNKSQSFVYSNGAYSNVGPEAASSDHALAINNEGQVLGQSNSGYYVATPGIPPLFDDNANLVDFNVLLTAQISAINSGTGLYDAMGGNDDVALPDPGHFQLTNSVTWDPAQTFYGGAGDDLIDLHRLGSYSSGAVLKVDGDGPAVTSGHDTIELPGSPADYDFTVNFNQNNLDANQSFVWRNTATTIATTGDGGLPANIDVVATDVEKVTFATKIDNVVSLTDNNVAIEMLQLAAESYGPDARVFTSHDPLAWDNPNGNNTGAKATESAEDRNWHSVAAAELGMLPADYGSGSVQYSFVGGQYQALGTLNGEADAIVLTGVVNGVRTLAIAIRGTDQLADIPDYATGFSTYYQKFQPLVQALHDYVSDPSNGIGQVLISGHSLGAGAVPFFMNVFNDTGITTIGYTDGFPNSNGSYTGSNLENFNHSGTLGSASVGDHVGDPVPILGSAYLGVNHSSGTYISIDSDVPQDGFALNVAGYTASLAAGFTDTSFFGAQHNENLYELDLARILQFARDPDSALYGTPFGLSLVNNTIYQSPVAIAVGQPQDSTLEELMTNNFLTLDPNTDSFDPNDLAYKPDVHVYARDNYVLGTPNGRIIWDRPSTGDTLHIVDGANDGVVLLPYGGTYTSTFGGIFADLSLGGQLIAHLYRVKSIMIGDAGTINGQLFINVDGSTPNVQTLSAGSNALQGQTSGAAPTFVIDHSYDYADLGDSDWTVTGTNLGDIIYVGKGNDTINEGAGSDIIIVKDVASAGNLVVHGGAGDDTVVAGAGNDQLFGDAGQDALHGNGGHDVLHGGADADTFFLDSSALGSGAVTEIADYDQGNQATFSGDEADIIDLTGLFGASALQADPSGLTLARLVDDPSNNHVLLQVDTDGAANGIQWTTLAQLDGVHAGDSVSAVLDDTQSLGLSLMPLTNAGHFGDFDGDGKADLVWRNDDGSVATWSMNGGTVAAGNFLIGVGSDWHIQGTGDFNGDGKADILWQNNDGTLIDWQSANSAQTVSLGTTPADSELAGIGDFDHDGKSDFVWRDATTGAVTINTMAGGTNTLAIDESWQILGVGDYNGDGNADIMFRNAGQNINAAWLMNGTNFSSAVFYPGVPNDWHVEATGDFNGDGTADLFWHNDNGANAVWLMDPHSNGNILAAGFFDGVGSDWHVVGSGDFNGDHKDDIVWRDNDGSTAVWLMNGTNAPTVSFPGGVPADWTTQAHHYEYV